MQRYMYFLQRYDMNRHVREEIRQKNKTDIIYIRLATYVYSCTRKLIFK